MSESKRKSGGTQSARPWKEGKTPVVPPPADRIKLLINGVPVELPPELEAAVQRAYKGLMGPLPKEMTTNQAAEFLDVSRPFVIKLVKQGELPCRMVGKHRRIPSEALVQYREKMFQRAREAADELTQMAEEMGLYEEEKPSPKGQ